MRIPRLRFAALALVSGIALSGCAYDMYGDPYGYGSVGVGIGYGGYGGYGAYGGYYGDPYSGYGYAPYASYGYGYGGYDPFGWYGDYYYPGAGIYVYDSNRRAYRWNDRQRHYWSDRRSDWQRRTGSSSTRENWSGWNRGSTAGTTSTTSHWHPRDGRH